MPAQRRAEKTTEKTRRGGLPAATLDPPEYSIGVGQPCDGCGETIEPTERRHRIRVRGVLELYFHSECHTAWLMSKAR